VRPLSSAQAAPIPNTEGAVSPFFSADGASIGFVRVNQLFTMSLAGGSPLRIGNVNNFTGARWAEDGTIYYADAAKGLYRVNAKGGAPDLIVPVQAGEVVVAPETLPGSEWLLYGESQGSAASAQINLMALNLRTLERRLLLENGGSARYARTGHLLSRGMVGARITPFDPARAVFTGPPIALDDTEFSDMFTAPDVSVNGTLLWVSIATNTRIPVWLSRQGLETPLPLEPGRYTFPRLSPDGKRVMLSLAERTSGAIDVWTYDIDGSASTRLTFDGKSSSAVWSADGRRIAFAGSDGGLYIRGTDGSSQVKRLGVQGSRYPYGWTPSDKGVLFTELGGAALDIGVVDIDDPDHPHMLLNSPASETRPALSPDGRWLAYSSDESGRMEVYVRPFPNVGAAQWQVSNDGGHSPAWSADGRELVFRARTQTDTQTGLTTGTFVSARRRPGDALSFDAPRPLFKDTYANDTGGRSYDLTADGRFLVLKETAGSAAVHITLNWFEELTQLTAAKTK